MRKSTIFKTAVVLTALLCLGYLADRYFRLPGPQALPEQKGRSGEIGAGRGLDRFNILVLGLDGRQGLNDRADTIILASLDAEKKEAQLLSVPRDTRVKIKGSWDKVNAAYAYGGVELTKKTITDFLGVEIDRYVVADFKSLIRLVDELGGIDVDVPVRMYVPLEGIDLQPGWQHLNGEQVLAYTRFRGTSEGDIGRIKRQQQVISLLAEKALKAQNLARLPQLIPIFQEDVKTDLTVKELGALARIAPAVLEKGISACVLPGGNKKIDGLWYWEPDLPAMKKLLATSLGATRVAQK